MVLHFHFTFKPFPGHAQKREIERKREREKERRESRDRPKPSLLISSADITSTAPIARSADHNGAKRRSQSREVSRFDDFFSGFCLCFEK